VHFSAPVCALLVEKQEKEKSKYQFFINSKRNGNIKFYLILPFLLHWGSSGWRMDLDGG
jgi:hypothetical protein